MFALGRLAAKAIPFLTKALPRAARAINSFKGGSFLANAIKGAKSIAPNIAKGFGGFGNFLERGSSLLGRGISGAEKIGKGVQMARSAGLIPSNQSSVEQAARRGLATGKRVRDDVDRLSGGARQAQKFAKSF